MYARVHMKASNFMVRKHLRALGDKRKMGWRASHAPAPLSRRPMQVPVELTSASAGARRRLPAADALALREALDADLANACAASRDAAIRRACAGARAHGLSAPELILEVKAAWTTLPASRRTMHPDAPAVVERFVSGCIEEYYRG